MGRLSMISKWGKRSVWNTHFSLTHHVSACKVPVAFTIHNRSPILPVRFMLYLPSPSPSVPSIASEPSALIPARFIGNLIFRGTLKSGETHVLNSAVWVYTAGLMSLKGWKLIVETGEVGVDTSGWIPRKIWSKKGSEKVVEIRGI